MERNADGLAIPDPLQAHSKKGETPLIWAAMQQQLDCTKVLIAARANLNAQVEGVDGKAWAGTVRQPTS